ncbi:MAG TPA: isocitrate lyase/phosphoenolpyruvate mutase family protein [Eoetvoesiella sp.]
MATTIEAKRAAFRALHNQGHFVLPNPWDLGGLRRLEKLGFKAVATSSAGYAWSLGRDDFQITLDEILSHLMYLSNATDLPVNVDFEAGFADAPNKVADNVKLAVNAGAAGLSIEDRTGNNLYPLSLSIERIQAAHDAIKSTGRDVLLVGRCEGLLTGTTTQAETIERMTAYANAGADVLYAPGIKDQAAIKALLRAVAPKPVNVLLLPGMRVDELAALGVRRMSTGSGLARAAWSGFESAAQSILNGGQLPL